MKLNRWLFCFISFVFFTSSVFAKSQVDAKARPSVKRGGPPPTQLLVGVGGGFFPKYAGSNVYDATALPYFLFTYRRIFTIDPIRGITVSIPITRKLIVGPSLNYNFGRDDEVDSVLRGFDQVGRSWEVGGFVRYRFARAWSVYSAVHRDLEKDGDDHGTSGYLQGSYMMFLGPKLILQPSLRVSFADKRYMQTFYGIEQHQYEGSQNSVPLYNAEGGVRSAGLSLMAIYRITDRFSFVPIIGYRHLLGGARSTPLTKTVNQGYAIFNFSYRLI